MKDYSSLERASSRFAPTSPPSPGPSPAPTRAARVLGRSGGYRRSYAFAMTCLIYHATTTFCRRNYNYKNDALGKTVGQMVGAARSARQNIVEGGVSEALTKARLEVRDAQRSVDRNGEKVVCPKCGAPMRKRLCKRGVNAGQPFWACSRYPECDGTRRYE